MEKLNGSRDRKGSRKKGNALPVLHRATIFIRFTSTSSARSVTRWRKEERRDSEREKEGKEEEREKRSDAGKFVDIKF